MKKSLGFTLIELIIVIIILGILAVTAAPRFMDMSTDAKIATLSGFEAALKDGVKLFKMKSKIQNSATVDTPYGLYDAVGTGDPEPKSEATNPNLYFIETFIKLPPMDVENKTNASRTAVHGDIAVYEDNVVSRIGYGNGNLVAEACYTEYRRDAGVIEFNSVTAGC